MTDFVNVELPSAPTQGGRFYSAGFDVRKEDWPKIKEAIIACDSGNIKTLEFTEEDGPREVTLGDAYRWVWVVSTPETPLKVILYLSELSRGAFQNIRFLPNEYP